MLSQAKLNYREMQKGPILRWLIFTREEKYVHFLGEFYRLTIIYLKLPKKPA